MTGVEHWPSWRRVMQQLSVPGSDGRRGDDGDGASSATSSQSGGGEEADEVLARLFARQSLTAPRAGAYTRPLVVST